MSNPHGKSSELSNVPSGNGGIAASPLDSGGMEGDGVSFQVKRIHDKLQLLLRQRDNLLKENRKLKEEMVVLKQEQGRYSNRFEQLQQQVEILKASGENMNEGEKKVLEKRLGQYIREIDRCIALLSE
jgi:hypothetical protein